MLCYAGKRGITTINYKKIFFILLRIDGNAGLRGGLLLYCRRYRGPVLPAGVYYYYYFILFFKDFSLLPPLSRSSATSRCLLLLYLHIYRAYRPRAKRRNKAFIFYVFVYLFISLAHIYRAYRRRAKRRDKAKPRGGECWLPRTTCARASLITKWRSRDAAARHARMGLCKECWFFVTTTKVLI